MSGNAASPQSPDGPRRKIQALSVSVNYADFLECVAPNIQHFDRWLVVTVEEDTRTQEVCRRWGLDVLISKRLYKDGATFHKAAALNEGLEVLDQDAWVAVMDSDILLPRDFRERLDAQTLDSDCLYGLSGRRICCTLPEFRSLAEREPWADNLIYTTFVIGYFNLFHLGQELNRYPENFSDDASSYDVMFSESFPAARRHYLPFVCLHAGESSQNWRGRTTDPFFEDGTSPNAPAPPSRTEEIAALLGGHEKTAAQIGCYSGAFSRALARHFSSVTVIDHWGLLVPSPSPALATDLKILAGRYASETAGLVNVTSPLEHSDETLAAIPDASLDVIWLTAEPEYDFLLQFLPAWLPKLKPGGAIAGGFYEPELLPGSSRVVQLLLGAPDQAFPDMQWVRRIADPGRLAARIRPPQVAGSTRGVVYVSMGEHDVEALLVSLSSLQRHWDGPVSVLSAGDESASLRLACVRLGVDFRNVPCAAANLPDELNRLHALDWSPFEQTVFIEAASLVTGSPQFLFDALDGHTCAFCDSHGSAQMPANPAAFAWHRSSPVLDAWRSLARTLFLHAGRRAIRETLGFLKANSMFHVLPSTGVWSGSARRAPAGTRILSLHRLARAGALHLYQPWADEEQALLARMEAGI